MFGADRAAMLTAQLPASAAEKTADRDQRAAALRRQLKKIETGQAALMTELEETGAGTGPGAADYRQRIRSRYRERAAAEQQLTEPETSDTGHPAEPDHATSTTASSTLNFGSPAQHTLVCLLTQFQWARVDRTGRRVFPAVEQSFPYSGIVGAVACGSGARFPCSARRGPECQWWRVA